MSVQVNTKLTGNLAAELSRFEKAVQEKVLFSGVAAMAKVMYDEAVTNASGLAGERFPKRKTGKLASSIYRAYSAKRSTDEKKTYRLSWDRRKAPHGHLIEFGTSRAPAYPFIRPAFDHVGEAIAAGKARMEQRLSEGVV